MKSRQFVFEISVLVFVVLVLAGCGTVISGGSKAGHAKQIPVTPDSSVKQLEKGLFAVRYDGDYGFEGFLSQGGASSDREVAGYLSENLLKGQQVGFLKGIFGCSTLSVKNENGESLFGRNFDWENCEAMVVMAYPENGYASVSTVNMDFIGQGAGNGAAGMALKLDTVKTLAALYAPLDGMNEAGLAVAVNMIQDSAVISQDTEKPDLTTTTAIRLLLDQAADVEEALELLSRYDMHSSMGMMVHFAIADSAGRSIVVEYIDQEMVVTDTPAVTNFYLAEGKKNGIGTAQSHERYELLMERLESGEPMSAEQVRDALDRVSKDNFGEFESTEWSIVFNQETGEASYYHRENYDKSYVFVLE